MHESVNTSDDKPDIAPRHDFRLLSRKIPPVTGESPSREHRFGIMAWFAGAFHEAR